MRLFVSYPHVLRACVGELVCQLRNAGLSVHWDHDIQGGSPWVRRLESDVRASDVMLFIVASTTADTHWQAEELTLAIARNARVVPVLMDGAEIPFGVRSLQALQARTTDEPVWGAVVSSVVNLQTAFPARTPDAVRGSFDGIGELGVALRPWCTVMATDPPVWALATEAIDWLRDLLRRTPAEEMDVHIAHSARVLNHLHGLLTSRDPDTRAIEPDWRLESAADAFVAAFAVVLHNLFWVDVLPDRPLGRRSTLVDRALSSGERMRLVVENLTTRIRSERVELVHVAAQLCAEHFVDAPSWRRRAPKFTALTPLPARYAGLARQLRRAEACDVGHRFACDLIASQFELIGYSDGLECYLRHSYLKGIDLMLARPPELVDNVLRLSFRRFPKDQTICAAFRLAKALVLDELRATFKAIDRSTQVRSIVVAESESASSDDVLPLVYWAFFPLAIAQPASDTRAAQLAVSLLPALVGYICRSDPRLTREAEHTKVQTAKLLSAMLLLRPGSQALAQVVGESSRALALVEPRDYVETLSAVAAVYEGVEHDMPHSTAKLARTVFCYGVCVLGAQLIAQAACDPVQSHRELRMIRCTRRLIRRRGRRWEGILPRSEDREMAKEIRRAMRRKDVKLSKLVRGPEIDAAHVPAAFDPPGQDVELLVGARAFTADAEGRLTGFVGLYGTRTLALSCRAHGVVLRVVTSHDRLENPVEVEHHVSASRPIEFSYSDMPAVGTEDEWVELALVGMITTQRGTEDLRVARRALRSDEPQLS